MFLDYSLCFFLFSPLFLALYNNSGAFMPYDFNPEE